jgi:hypothetical protein
MSSYYVYVYKDPSRNYEPIYIGKGSGYRAWDHLKSKNTKSHFINRLNIMKTNGIDPLIEILMTVDDEETAFSLEIWFIFKYGRRDLKTGTLCNLTGGGDGIINLSEEAKARSLAKRTGQKRSQKTCESISVALKGKKRNSLTDEHKKKISDGGVGLKRTQETRDNISKALKGKMLGVSKPAFSEEHKENIKLARIGMKHSEDTKANMRKPKNMRANMRACTLDGINIFESVGALKAALGTGKTGTRSPNLQFIKD